MKKAAVIARDKGQEYILDKNKVILKNDPTRVFVIMKNGGFNAPLNFQYTKNRLFYVAS